MPPEFCLGRIVTNRALSTYRRFVENTPGYDTIINSPEDRLRLIDHEPRSSPFASGAIPFFIPGARIEESYSKEQTLDDARRLQQGMTPSCASDVEESLAAHVRPGLPLVLAGLQRMLRHRNREKISIFVHSESESQNLRRLPA